MKSCPIYVTLAFLGYDIVQIITLIVEAFPLSHLPR